MKRCPKCGGWMAPADPSCLSCGYQNPEPVAYSELPEGIKGWSWGAFIFGWIWAIFNRTWIGILGLIPIVGFVMSFVLGFKGREWAWKNKQWESVEHFKRVQKNWSIAGFIFLAVAIGGGIALGAFESSVEEYRAQSEQALNDIEKASQQTQQFTNELSSTGGLDIHDLLGANRAYVDQQLGVARTNFQDMSEYNSQDCQVFVKFENNHVSEVSVNLNTGCQVSAWLINRMQSISNSSRLIDLVDGVLMAYYDCLSGCGNAYDPALHFALPASRASNGIYHYLSTINYELPDGLVESLEEPWESGELEAKWVGPVFALNKQARLSSITAGLDQ